MASFDELLTHRRYLAGHEFSMPDITMFAGPMFADLVGLPIAPEFHALHTWRTIGNRAVVAYSAAGYLGKDH